MSPRSDDDNAASASSEAHPVVVGLGASAGGLEVFRQVLQALPADSGFAFALVQHLSPEHESRLPELLQPATSMPVTQVEEATPLEPDHVYVIAPGSFITLEDGILQPSRRPASHGAKHMPVDHFFRSLADEVGDRAVGVVLSGTASDGTEGLRHIRAVGGVSLAQDPQTATHDGMPRSAIAAGVVDRVLDPEGIGQELARLARHPYVRPWAGAAGGPEDEAAETSHEPAPARDPAPPEAEGEAEPGGEQEALKGIYGLLRRAAGVDFANYKEGTFRRRLERRMMIQGVEDVERYASFLEDHPDEVEQLYEDVLIHVTRFFRNPEVFQALKETVFPEVAEARGRKQPIRVWVAGCATGEEAYSVAIALMEYLTEARIETPVNVFATDVHDGGIAHARAGVYRESIAADVSEERLHRFFTPSSNGGYRVSKTLREVCVFSRHDLTRDPPFSHIDVLVCRNVLIYLGQAVQDRVMDSFHYGLKPTGYLVLGEAETPRQDSELFTAVDQAHRIYAPLPASPRIHGRPVGTPDPSERWELGPSRAEPQTSGIQREADRFVVNHFGPPGVVVDEDHRIHYVLGSTSPYLEAPPGEPTHDLMKMAREGLMGSLRSALSEAHSSGRRTRSERVHVLEENDFRSVTVEVVPLQTGDRRRYFLVLFEAGKAKGAEGAESITGPAQREPAAAPPGESGGSPPATDERLAEPSEQEKDDRIRSLEEELASSRNYLRSVIQDLEATNEELQTANEEILSANEELQSTNEELDTTREELQSTNEELNTLNDELRGRNEDLAGTNADLENLLASLELPVVIVDGDLRVRRITPVVEDVMNLMGGDIGRPIGHISPNFESPDLEQLIRRCITDISPTSRQVSGRHGHEGRWFNLVIKPYRGADNTVDGAVLSLYDVTALKQRERDLDRARRYAEAVAETVHEPLAVLDGASRVLTVNRPFCEAFEVTAEGIVGRRLQDLSPRHWDIQTLGEVLEEVTSREAGVEGHSVKYTLPGTGERTFHLNARRVSGDGDAVAGPMGEAEDGPEGGLTSAMIFLAFEDVTT